MNTRCRRMGTVCMREDIRRDGLAMHFLMDGDAMLPLASAIPSAIINIGYPAICGEELQVCQRITRALARSPVETAVVGHASARHLGALEAVVSCAENTSANVWVPSSRQLARQMSSIGPDELVLSCVDAVRQWATTHATPIDVALVDASAEEDGLLDHVLWMAEQFSLAGCRQIIVGDTMGIGTPESLSPIFRGLNEMHIPFEFHGHDDGGCVYANIVAANNEGAVGVGCAALGLGERSTMPDTAHVAEILSLPFDAVAYAEFSTVHAQYRADNPGCEELLNPRTVTTGAQLRLRKGGMGTRLLFGVTSDRRVLGEILGIEPRLTTPELLRTIKDWMYRERRCYLTEPELRERMTQVGFL